MGCCGNVASVSETPFISSCISYFEHACLKSNLVIISLLTGECATQNLTNAVLVYGHVDILWTYQGARIKMMILA